MILLRVPIFFHSDRQVDCKRDSLCQIYSGLKDESLEGSEDEIIAGEIVENLQSGLELFSETVETSMGITLNQSIF
jgi:hypothetical protein